MERFFTTSASRSNMLARAVGGMPTLRPRLRSSTMVAGVSSTSLTGLLHCRHLGHLDHGGEGHGLQGPEHLVVVLPGDGHGQGDVAVSRRSLLGDDGLEVVLAEG